jgi:hypothetical protein
MQGGRGSRAGFLLVLGTVATIGGGCGSPKPPPNMPPPEYEEAPATDAPDAGAHASFAPHAGPEAR